LGRCLSLNFSNSKFNCSEIEKRPEKYAGFPAGWEKAGPLPLLFSTATPSALFGSLFGPLRNGNAVKKEKKGKKMVKCSYGRRNRG
jgi:hypothetical protein